MSELSREEQIEFLQMKVRAYIGCSHCTEVYDEFPADEIAREAYRHGWVIDQDGFTCCPDCIPPDEDIDPLDDGDESYDRMRDDELTEGK